MNMERLILICVDSVRPDFLGCHGGVARTLTLDRLASEGVRFEQSMAASTLTSICMAAVHTGLAPPLNGLRSHFHQKLPKRSLTLAERLSAAGYATGCFAYPVGAGPIRDTNRGFDTYEDITAPHIYNSGFCPGLSHWSKVEEWLRANRKGKFFLYLHTMQMHNPYVCGHNIRTEQDKLRREADIHQPGVMKEAYREALETYDQRYLSAFINELDGMGILDETVIAVCSDHGDGLFDHGEKMHGSSLFDSLLKTVMIIRAPGQLPAGRVVEEQFRSIDVAPTLMDVVGVPPVTPAAPGSFAGVSWKEAICQQTIAPDTVAYSELHDMGLYSVRQRHDGAAWKLLRSTPRSPYSMERTGGVKGVLWEGSVRARRAAQRLVGRNAAFDVSLFNLTKDPGERANCLAFPSAPDTGARTALRRSFSILAQETEAYAADEAEPFTSEEAAAVNERLKDLGYL